MKEIMTLDDLFVLIEELRVQGIHFELGYAGFGNNLVIISLSKYNHAEYDDYGNPVKYTIRRVFECELSEYFGQFVSQMVEELETIMKGEEQ